MGKCIICNKEYTGMGNNAQPVGEGRCCDKCNAEFVVIARLYQMLNKGKENK